MKKKEKTIYIVSSIILVLILVLGITYAYWLITRQQTKENIITTGCLKIELTNEQDDITLPNAHPITDEEGRTLTPYTFTVKNNCDTNADYTIGLEMLDDTTLDSKYVKYELSEVQENEYTLQEEVPLSYVYAPGVSANTTEEYCNNMLNLIQSSFESYGVSLIEGCTMKENKDRIYVGEVTQEGFTAGYGFKTFEECQSALQYVRDEGEGEIVTECTQPDEIYSFQIGKTEKYNDKIACYSKKQYAQANGLSIIKDCEASPLEETITNRLKTRVLSKEDPEDEYIVENAKEGRILKQETIAGNDEKKYQLRLWLDYDADEGAMSKNYRSKIVIKATNELPGTLRTVDRYDTNGMWNYREQISKIIIQDSITPIEGAEGPFDESRDQDGSVISYVKQNEEDEFYTAYLQGNGKIKLNPNSSDLFYNFLNVTSIEGMKNLDTSNVTNMSDMFTCMNNLQELDLSSFDTSNVTNMSSMFADMSSLQELDIRHFDTSQVTDMSDMFEGMSNLKSLDLSQFDTSNVTDMSDMFFQVSQIQELDLSHLDTSQVQNMQGMFFQMRQIQELDLSSFDTRNVTNMIAMFCGMSNLQKLNLSSFDTSQVMDMSTMFYDDELLTTITYGPKFVHNAEATMNNMFDRCPAKKPDASVDSSWEGVSFE